MEILWNQDQLDCYEGLLFGDEKRISKRKEGEGKGELYRASTTHQFDHFVQCYSPPCSHSSYCAARQWPLMCSPRRLFDSTPFSLPIVLANHAEGTLRGTSREASTSNTFLFGTGGLACQEFEAESE